MMSVWHALVLEAVCLCTIAAAWYHPYPPCVWRKSTGLYHYHATELAVFLPDRKPAQLFVVVCNGQDLGAALHAPSMAATSPLYTCAEGFNTSHRMYAVKIALFNGWINI